MATSATPQRTDFTLDVMGRYTCNGIDEALRSTDRSIHADARPFDFIIIGGGSFSAVLAARLLRRDATYSHRILP